MEASLLEQGLSLMLVGMGTVFTFLTLLVIAMSIMSMIAKRNIGQPSPTAAPEEEEVAAITAAIRQHRKMGSK